METLIRTLERDVEDVEDIGDVEDVKDTRTLERDVKDVEDVAEGCRGTSGTSGTSGTLGTLGFSRCYMVLPWPHVEHPFVHCPHQQVTWDPGMSMGPMAPLSGLWRSSSDC